MIKKRQPKQEINNKQKEVEQIKTVKKPVQEKTKPVYKEFKTYREEACYVLDLLEQQGVYIYEEGRYGGMYLNRHSGGRYGHIFTDTKNNKKQIEPQEINNNEFSDNDLSKLFSK